MRSGAVLGERRTHVLDLAGNLFAVAISQLIGLKFLDCRLRLCNLGIKTRQLRFVLGKLLIVEALLQNRVLHQVAIGLLSNDQWATVEQRLVTCDLRLEARNLLTQLLDVRGSES